MFWYKLFITIKINWAFIYLIYNFDVSKLWGVFIKLKDECNWLTCDECSSLNRNIYWEIPGNNVITDSVIIYSITVICNHM